MYIHETLGGQFIKSHHWMYINLTELVKSKIAHSVDVNPTYYIVPSHNISDITI
jgi:hypothetical protein